VVESKAEPGRRALKLHRDVDAYKREKAVYERLRERRIDAILGFDIPVPLRFDDDFMAIEMSIVMRRSSWISPVRVWMFRRNFQKRFGPIGRSRSESNSARIGKRFWRSWPHSAIMVFTCLIPHRAILGFRQVSLSVLAIATRGSGVGGIRFAIFWHIGPRPELKKGKFTRRPQALAG
jgi:hypothetical protein